MDETQDIISKLRSFNKERNWDQFHDAKNLALALSIEAAELNEAFLWKKSEDVDVKKIKEELADVLLCAFMIADKYNLNIKDICLEKIELNAEKYPIDKAKGSCKKYNELK
jgi:NTP pyrophosphatase (non-canonical NTP hydrolase)